MISFFFKLSTSFQQFVSSSRVDDGCDAFSFFNAIVRNCGVRVLIKTLVSLYFLKSCVLSEVKVKLFVVKFLSLLQVVFFVSFVNCIA